MEEKQNNSIQIETQPQDNKDNKDSDSTKPLTELDDQIQIIPDPLSSQTSPSNDIKLEIATVLFLLLALVVLIVIITVFGNIPDLFLKSNNEYLFLSQLVGVVMSFGFYLFEIVGIIVITIVTHHVGEKQKRKFVFGIFIIITSAILTAITLCTAIDGSMEIITSEIQVSLESKLSIEKEKSCCFDFIEGNTNCACESEPCEQCIFDNNYISFGLILSLMYLVL